MTDAMERQLLANEAVDLQDSRLNEEGDYILGNSYCVQNVDYCDHKRKVWIWSIGEHKETSSVNIQTTSACGLILD